MAQELNVAKLIHDDGKSFYALDFIKLLNAHLLQDDEVLVPVNVRNGHVSFWETGGKDATKSITAACLIATEDNTIPDALVFGKLYRSPNRRQALVALRPDYRLYIGKANAKNTLAPKVKILELRYTGSDRFDHGLLGRFVVEKVYNSYQDIVGNVPAERLFDKMFTKDVMRPFFANGWTITNLSKLISIDSIPKQFIRLMSESAESIRHTNATEFLDDVEDELVRLNVPRLSAALQWFDFTSRIVGIKPLVDLQLSNIDDTLEKASSSKSFSIEIEELLGCYNPKIIFNNDNIATLEKALELDATVERKHVLNLGGSVYGVLRGYQG